MELLRAQRLKSGNSRSFTFIVLMFGLVVMSAKEGSFFISFCIGMLLISLSFWCKGKYSGK